MDEPSQLLFVNFASDSFGLDVVKYIEQNHECDLIMMSQGFGENIQFNGSRVELIDLRMLYREETIFQAFQGCAPIALERDTLKAFHECKSYFMRTLDRVFMSPRSVRSNESYFLELLTYILSFFTKKKSLKAVFFYYTPHFPWETVIFFAARYLGIETRILRRTLLDDRVVLDKDFRAECGEFVRFSAEEDFIGHGREKEKNRESFWLDRAKAITNQSNYRGLSWRPTTFLPIIPLWIRKFTDYKNGYMLLNPIEFLYRLFAQKVRLIKLKTWFTNNADVIELSTHFVYFALHYQPERSTDPEGQEFSHQHLAIRLLSEALPDGWKIYVKEHPRQLSDYPDIKQAHYRSAKDYVKIKSIPNVRMLPPTYDSTELRSHCRMTASCSGSIVWEGMAMGKPGINFGRVWHSECRSSLLVNSAADAANAFKILSSKSESEVLKDVKDFCKEFQSCLIVSVINDEAAKVSAVSRHVLVSNLASAIVKSLPCS